MKEKKNVEILDVNKIKNQEKNSEHSLFSNK